MPPKLTTVFKIIWPYLLRFLAKYAAEYLENRRQARLKAGDVEALAPSPESAPERRPVLLSGDHLSTGDAFWFTVSGILLGAGLGVALAYLTRREE